MNHKWKEVCNGTILNGSADNAMIFLVLSKQSSLKVEEMTPKRKLFPAKY